MLVDLVMLVVSSLLVPVGLILVVMVSARFFHDITDY